MSQDGVWQRVLAVEEVRNEVAYETHLVLGSTLEGFGRAWQCRWTTEMLLHYIQLASVTFEHHHGFTATCPTWRVFDQWVPTFEEAEDVLS